MTVRATAGAPDIGRIFRYVLVSDGPCSGFYHSLLDPSSCESFRRRLCTEEDNTNAGKPKHIYPTTMMSEGW
jgi:hypothetical protein